MNELLIRVKDGKATVITVVADAPNSIVVDGETIGLNPATGQPLTPVPGYVSELATLLTGLQSSTPHVATTTTGPTQAPMRVDFAPGKHYDFILGRGEKVVFARGEKSGPIAVHFQVPAGTKIGDHVDIKLAGVTTADVNGAAETGYGDRDAAGAPPMLNGSLAGYAVSAPVDGSKIKVGEYVNVYLTVTGGATEFFLESRIYRK